MFYCRPDNLLYASADPGALLKVVDYDLARKTRGGAISYPSRGAQGCMSYWAPELTGLVGARHTNTCASDLWSAGLVLLSSTREHALHGEGLGRGAGHRRVVNRRSGGSARLL